MIRTAIKTAHEGPLGKWEVHDIQMMASISKRDVATLGKAKAIQIMKDRMVKDLARAIVDEGYYMIHEEFDQVSQIEILGMRVRIVKDK